MSLLASWAVLTFSMFAASRLLDGIEIKGGAVDHFIVSAVFGALSFFVGWLVFLVLGVASLGLAFVFAFLTRFVVVAILLKLTSAFTKRLVVKSFGSALAASLVMAIVGTGTEWVIDKLL